MSLSRRGFLHYAARLPLASVAAMPWRTARLKTYGGKYCLILDSSCVLRESLEGYRATLSAAGLSCEVGSPRNCYQASLIVAPAASLTNSGEARWLRRQAEAGTLVLVESGGIFLSSADFLRHKSVAQIQFGLTLLPPVELWRPSESGIPYVDFTWPVSARVRDFSRAIPLVREGGGAVAKAEGKVVALKRRFGAASLVFLGSPLGPHLLAGDREAQRWLAAFCAQGDETTYYRSRKSRLNSVPPPSEPDGRVSRIRLSGR